MDAQVRARYEAAVAAAEHAGRIALDYFPPDGSLAAPIGEVSAGWKADRSPVTDGDRAAGISATRPADNQRNPSVIAQARDSCDLRGVCWFQDQIGRMTDLQRIVAVLGQGRGVGEGVLRPDDSGTPLNEAGLH